MLLVVASVRWESGFVGFACIGTEWEQSEQELQLGVDKIIRIIRTIILNNNNNNNNSYYF